MLVLSQEREAGSHWCIVQKRTFHEVPWSCFILSYSRLASLIPDLATALKNEVLILTMRLFLGILKA